MNNFCMRLKEARGGLSQAKVALLLGIKQQNWARWESGVAYPGAENLHRICESLHVSADWLLGLSLSNAPTVRAGEGAAINIGSGSANAANCKDCPILLDFIKRRSGG